MATKLLKVFVFKGGISASSVGVKEFRDSSNKYTDNDGMVELRVPSEGNVSIYVNGKTVFNDSY